MNNHLKIIAGSIAGAVSIHLILFACSSGGHSDPTKVPDAHADTPPPAPAPACTQWQVQTLEAPGFDPDNNPSGWVGVAADAPAGWEPYASLGTYNMYRRCKP